uniref:Dynein regulatory complex protein 1 n=1 Tax=Scleropages formosus TaxID=113540 RepID=A0A8C9R8S4_SCLFO
MHSANNFLIFFLFASIILSNEREHRDYSFFMYDKLQKEEQNTKVNLLRFTEQWRVLLRKKRVDELRRDVPTLSQTFERMLAHKDSIIKCLVVELEESEEQSSRVLQSHLQHMERLLEVHQARLDSLEQEWNTEIDELIKEFNAERELIMSQYEADIAYLEDVSFAMENHYNEVDNEAKYDFQGTHDDIKKKNIEEKVALQMQLEGAAEELRQQYQDVLQSYNKATEDRKNAYETLRSRDHHSARNIAAQNRKLQKMQANGLFQIIPGSLESELAAQELRAAKEEFALQVRQMKEQLSYVRARKRNQLTILAVHSNAAAKKLQGVMKKGEKLLRMSEMCHKLETSQEKTLLLSTSSLNAEEQSLRGEDIIEAPSAQLAKVAMVSYAALERFWQRYNKALLEKLYLERKRNVLNQENGQLQLLLRQCFPGCHQSEALICAGHSMRPVSRVKDKDEPL